MTRKHLPAPELLALTKRPDDCEEDRQAPAPGLSAAGRVGGLSVGLAPVALALGFDPFAVGRVVAGKYRIAAHLGSGGSAMLSLAVLQSAASVHKLVVLKYPLRSQRWQDGTKSKFIAEARLTSRMSHQHVIHVYEVVEHQGLPVIVMEYLDGHSLASVLSTHDEVPTFEIGLRLGVLAKMLAGLHHAHGLCDHAGRPWHVVHQDVSPQNVLLTCDGQVKLIDFGVACYGVTASGPATRIEGKLAYMAPEQLRGGVDRRADVFAAGILLWELITLRRFWGRASLSTVMRRLADLDIPHLSSLDEAMDSELASVCRRALAPHRDDRYPTAARMQADLERILMSRALFRSEADLGRVVQCRLPHQRLERQRQLQAVLCELDGSPGLAAAGAHVSATRTPRGFQRVDWERLLSSVLLAFIGLQASDSELPRAPEPLGERYESVALDLGSDQMRMSSSGGTAPRPAAELTVAPLIAAAPPPIELHPKDEARVVEPRRAREERPGSARAAPRRRGARRQTTAEPKMGALGTEAEAEIEPGIDLHRLTRVPAAGLAPESGRK